MPPIVLRAGVLIAFAAMAAGCEWVKMDHGATQVRVLRAGGQYRGMSSAGCDGGVGEGAKRSLRAPCGPGAR